MFRHAAIHPVGPESPLSRYRLKTPARIAVFVSGSGTNLQALLEHFNRRKSPIARVELVIANRDGIGGLERARRDAVVTSVIDPATFEGSGLANATLAALEARDIDLIVLAGYLKLVPAAVVARFRGAMLNIHPALLPAFGGPGMYGLRVHEAVIASGARVSGATVHLVDDRYDGGPIVAQWPVPVLVGDTAKDLAERVLRVEHLLLPAAIEATLRTSPREVAANPIAFDLRYALAPDIESVHRLLGSI